MSKNNCKILTNYEDIAIHTIFHVLILIIVLTAFFFIIVDSLEKKALSNQVINGINNGIKNIKIDKNKNVYDKLLKLELLYKGPNAVNTAYNNMLFIVCISTIVSIFMVFVTLIITLKISSGKCVNVFDIIIENMLLFICIGIVEYLFFIRIGVKYVPVKPSYMSELINNTLNN